MTETMQTTTDHEQDHRAEKPDPIDAPPTCDMVEGCTEPIAYLDRKGYIYCTKHVKARQSYQPCRKLRPFELNRIRRGEQVERY